MDARTDTLAYATLPPPSRGSDGSNDANGADGDQGRPGEMSNAALASIIGGTSNNSNAAAMLGQAADPNCQQSQIQDLINRWMR